ncbi:hypothetical protein Salat_0187400 [Sesamum alatum]|uniref:Uncharacterized protein n=1 Tax=Sesamum alatum TaxID=300844 RepID=A0AAE2CXZ3_9LAMI|nr:hypothetical protein Salat_0187400 [Sesamum alatum]
MHFDFKLSSKLRTPLSLNAGKVEGFSVGHAIGKEEGLREGHKAYLAFAQHKKHVADTGLQGAGNFLKSLAFQVAIGIKAINFLDQGFETCKSQVYKLRGFVEGFHLAWLDPTLDGNLVAFLKKVPPVQNDRFESLISKVEKMGTSS